MRENEKYVEYCSECGDSAEFYVHTNKGNLCSSCFVEILHISQLERRLND